MRTSDFSVLAHVCPGPHQTEQSLGFWQQAADLLQQRPFQLLSEQGACRDKFQLSLQLDALSNAFTGNPYQGALFRLQLEAIELQSANTPKAFERAAGLSLQQLYLALNLSLPGVGHLLACRYQQETEFYPAPGFSASQLEQSWLQSQDWQWPQLSTLSFEQAWNWLEQRQLSQIDIATTAVDKALFCLLELSQSHHCELQQVLSLAQVLELLTQAELDDPRLCEQRLQLLLGKPQRHQSWLHQFSEQRQQLRQNHRPLLRPGQLSHQQVLDLHPLHGEQQASLTVLAVVVSLLQQLIRQQAHQFRFSEQVELTG